MACKNSSKTIDKSLTSFFMQNYKKKEILIIDGGSTDMTLEKIKNYKINYFISKKNLGLYKSINYGIKKAKGNIIGLLHSDDFFYQKDVLRQINDIFEKNKNLDFIYSNIIFVDYHNNIKRKWFSGKINKRSVDNGVYPPHTGIFIKKNIFDKIGYYNPHYKIASDIDFMYRLFTKKSLNSIYFNKYTVKMSLGGLSTKSLKSIMISNFEVYKILKHHFVEYPLIVIIKKILSKLIQIFYK